MIGHWSLAIGHSSPAFGPAISVPIDLPRESRPLPAPNLIDQSREAAALKSRGCLECHVGTDEHTMHKSPNVVLGCTDCHGVHDIQKVDAPTSRVVQANLIQTCRKCHPDATRNFPESWLSHYEPTPHKAAAVWAVQLFYKIVIPFVVGGLMAPDAKT